MNLSVCLHFSSTQQAAVRALHNDSVNVSRRYTESNEKPMLPWITCSAHPKISSEGKKKKNSKSDWKLFLQNLRKFFL